MYVIFNERSFNNMLTNDIVSFEQVGPDRWVGLPPNILILNLQHITNYLYVKIVRDLPGYKPEFELVVKCRMTWIHSKMRCSDHDKRASKNQLFCVVL